MMKALSTWHIPFRILNTSRDIDEFFSFGGWDRAGMSWRLVPIEYVPQIDSYMDGNTFCIKADLPGVDPKEVELTVKEGVKAEEVQARYHNGVLEVTVPLPGAQMPKKVPVQIEGEERQSIAT